MFALIVGIAGAIASVAALVRLFEPRLAFFPSGGEGATPRDFGVEYAPLTIETGDGERLRAWSIAGESVRARILYIHGNGGNLSLWAPIVSAIAAQGFGVLAFDYRGYGLSTGRPTERGLYRDVEAVIQQFWRDPSAGVPVVYWGRSLGVAMAAYAATIREPHGLILESGFPDVRALMRNSPLLWLLAHLSTYRFPAAEFLSRLQSVPTLVMHGDDDRIVPITQGRALFGAIKGPKRFVTIRRGDHNDVAPSDPKAYWGAVNEFIERLVASS